MLVQFLVVVCSFSITRSRNIQLISPVGVGNSQYSPFVMHENGWNSFLMFYCKNTPSPIMRDRVWRIESFENGNTSRWINVIQGTSTSENDDLSCSPGIVIDFNGTWHNYYVVANRNTPLTLYLYHATSNSPGTTWDKHRELDMNFKQPFPGYLETPTPLVIEEQIALFIVGTNGCLSVSWSIDGYKFSKPETIPGPCGCSHGRMTYDQRQKIYHFVYSIAKQSEPENDSIPREIRISSSKDITKFPEIGELVINNQDVGSNRIWSPHAFMDGSKMRIYYAGNKGEYTWWGSNTAIFLYMLSSDELEALTKTD